MLVEIVVMVVLVMTIIFGEVARTGRRGRHSTTGLAVVSATVLSSAEFDQVVRENHSEFRRERSVEGAPI
jgi:hypothetical protein